jgi:hypothetical protein
MHTETKEPQTSPGSTCPAAADTHRPVSAEVFNQDCVAGMAERIGSSTVDLTVTSIPFEEL